MPKEERKEIVERLAEKFVSLQDSEKAFNERGGIGEMGYFNEGNDCDMCRHQILTGCDGDALDCRRREFELPCKFEERDIRTCPVCNNEVDREDMDFTKDCHGITFRLVCHRCWERLMSKGYDGEYYTEADEQIEDD